MTSPRTDDIRRTIASYESYESYEERSSRVPRRQRARGASPQLGERVPERAGALGVHLVHLALGDGDRLDHASARERRRAVRRAAEKRGDAEKRARLASGDDFTFRGLAFVFVFAARFPRGSQTCLLYTSPSPRDS